MKGALLYGLFIPLPANDYLVTFTIQVPDQCSVPLGKHACFEPTDATAREFAIQHLTSVTIEPSSQQLITFNFHLAKIMFGLEFKVMDGKHAQMAVLVNVNLVADTDRSCDTFPQ